MKRIKRNKKKINKFSKLEIFLLNNEYLAVILGLLGGLLIFTYCCLYGSHTFFVRAITSIWGLSTLFLWTNTEKAFDKLSRNH